jgi:hypothetical protein
MHADTKKSLNNLRNLRITSLANLTHLRIVGSSAKLELTEEKSQFLLFSDKERVNLVTT